MGGLYCVSIEILIRVEVCDCTVYNGPFRKLYFKYSENSLMMAPMEC